jgi:hypothetical protein
MHTGASARLSPTCACARSLIAMIYITALWA